MKPISKRPRRRRRWRTWWSRTIAWSSCSRAWDFISGPTAKSAATCVTLPMGNASAGATNWCSRSAGFGWAGTLTSARSAGRGPPGFLTGTICPQCGARLGANDFRPAPLVPVPQTVGTRRVANGQEVISIVGGLELNTPVWANEQHEFPYLQWQMEVHSAKLKAAFPHAAGEIAAVNASVNAP